MDKLYRDAIKHVLQTEGGFTDDKKDPGHRYRVENGELYNSYATNFGITQYTMSLYKRRQATRQEMLDMTEDQAIEIYYTNFIMKPKLDRIDKSVFPQIFDSAVNHGPGRPIMWIQKICNVARPDKPLAVDGALGPITIEAFNKVVAEQGGTKINNILVELRLHFYDRLILDNKDLKRFKNGWRKRALEFKQ